jgi:hypothetical protein
MRIAVMSDIHLGGDAKSPGGWMHAAASRPDDATDLIGGLRKLIRKQGLTADLILCPGDLADQASPQGLIRAWELAQSMRTELGSDLCIGAAGNHDADSFGNHTPGYPWKTLQELYPRFPIGSDAFGAENDAYWARGWCVFDHPSFRLVNVNSSRHHISKELAKRGQVELGIVNDLVEDLEEQGLRALNILLTHHHPWKVGVVNTTDNSHMDGGEVLLERLLNANVGPWVLIHGHKHVPRVDYFLGGARTIPTIAAGSLAARLWDAAAAIAKNQFYVFDFDVPATGGLDDIAARCEAWSWVPSSGWGRASKSGGIMWGSGFGWRDNLKECAAVVSAVVDGSHRSWIDRAELVAAEPRYECLISQEQLALHDLLRANGFVIVDDDGILEEIGRRP